MREFKLGDTVRVVRGHKNMCPNLKGDFTIERDTGGTVGHPYRYEIHNKDTGHISRGWRSISLRLVRKME